jgi:hypothetical protein
MILTISVTFNVGVSTFGRGEKIKMIGEASIEFVDSKIMACFDRKPFQPAYSIAQASGVLHSMVLRYLRDSLGIKTFIFDGSRKLGSFSKCSYEFFR